MNVYVVCIAVFCVWCEYGCVSYKNVAMYVCMSLCDAEVGTDLS